MEISKSRIEYFVGEIMTGIECVQEALKYIDSNLNTVSGVKEVAAILDVSETLLRESFKITGYGLSEYIRNRKLYEAGREIKAGHTKIIEVSYKYGYESPESFTRAFSKFHNATPSEILSGGKSLKFFGKIDLGVSSGKGIAGKYEITKFFPIKLIGIVEIFDGRPSGEEVYNLWEKFYKKTGRNVFEGGEPKTDIERAIVENSIGEYGVLVKKGDSHMHYYIAGKYAGGTIPEGMELLEYAADDWLVCKSSVNLNNDENNNIQFRDRYIKSQKKGYSANSSYEIQWFGNKLGLEHHLENKCYEEWIPLECSEGRIKEKIPKVVTYIGMIICGVILGALLMNIKVKRSQLQVYVVAGYDVNDAYFTYESDIYQNSEVNDSKEVQKTRVVNFRGVDYELIFEEKNRRGFSPYNEAFFHCKDDKELMMSFRTDTDQITEIYAINGLHIDSQYEGKDKESNRLLANSILSEFIDVNDYECTVNTEISYFTESNEIGSRWYEQKEGFWDEPVENGNKQYIYTYTRYIDGIKSSDAAKISIDEQGNLIRMNLYNTGMFNDVTKVDITYDEIYGAVTEKLTNICNDGYSISNVQIDYVLCRDEVGKLFFCVGVTADVSKDNEIITEKNTVLIVK